MKLAAIVPLNSRAQAKTRLASALDARDRAALSHWLAERVLGALRDARVGHIAVVSPDDEVLRWAWQGGAYPLRQQGEGLNGALDEGRAWALEREAEALLVALGDLPLLTGDDVLALVSSLEGAPAVAIAPDRALQGTNMLLMRPPSALPFAFGENSLARHIALARATGVAPRIARLPNAAFDVDTPDDLRELITRGLWRPSVPFEPRHSLWAGEAS